MMNWEVQKRQKLCDLKFVSRGATVIEVVADLDILPRVIVDLIAEYHVDDFFDRVQELNMIVQNQNKRVKWFVCAECNWLVEGDAEYYAVNKWGDERPFCEGCLLECPDPNCEETPFAPSMSYRHEDCRDPYDSDQ